MIPFIYYNNKYCVTDIQNLVCLGVSIIITSSIICHYFYPIDFIIYKLFPLVFIHCITDLFLTRKPDIILHHLLCLSMSTYMYSKQLPLGIVSTQAITVLSLETSTIFLVTREYLDKSSFLYKINNICFVSTFIYLRIYLLIKHLFLDERYLYYMNNNNSTYELFWYHTGLYSFLLLNLYWGFIIVKSIMKPVRKQFKIYFTYRLSEFLLQFTYFLSPVISLYTYIDNNKSDRKSLIMIDLFGQSILSINSFNYHRAIFNQIKKDEKEDNKIKNDEKNEIEINLLSPNIYKYYIFDILSIHIRSFLSTIVNLSAGIEIKNINFIAGWLLYIHLCSLFHFYHDILDNILSKTAIIYASKDRLIEYVVRAPIFIEILITIMHSNSLVASNHNLISLFGIILLLHIKPFYELNHFVLHILLLYQTYGLTACNNSLF